MISICIPHSLKLGQSLKYQSYSRCDIRIMGTGLFGFWFFNEIPDLYTWIGGFMIISATSYVAHREAQIRKNNI